jgi:hypothetical protein
LRSVPITSKSQVVSAFHQSILKELVLDHAEGSSSLEVARTRQ